MIPYFKIMLYICKQEYFLIQYDKFMKKVAFFFTFLLLETSGAFA